MSANMSDMKAKAPAKKTAKRPVKTQVCDTFTVRDMNRRPQAVLTAARLLGSVTIRSRNGGDFVVSPKDTTPNKRVQEAEAFVERQRAFRAKLRAMGFVPPSKEDSERIARMIAGEDP
jgi:hypothetical protein